MKRLVLLAASALLLLPIAAAAQSAFDGTWKIDINKADFGKKPDVFLLKDGMYSCKTCVPAYTVKADGNDQAVSGHPYYDSVAIKVVSDHEIQETDKKGGKTVGTSTSKVSADGNTVMFSFVDSSNTNGGPPVTGKGEAVRVAPGPAGSSALSGSWRTSKIEGLSDNATLTKYMVMGGELMMSSPTGQTYTAKLDGTEAPMKGDPGVTSVSVKMMGKNMLEETDKRNGKVIGVFKMTIQPDGKTANASYDDRLMNRTSTFVMMKQ
jgi:opacity protein-like surface antigen